MEDQRVLRLPPLPTPPPILVGRRTVPAPAPPVRDLTLLVADGEARVRRRAALAIGRVGLAEGVPPVVSLLADPEPEVRQMAAFALGLLGDARAVDPLAAALADASPIVRGRAAEALGALDARPQAQAIASMASAYVTQGVLAGIGPDDLTYPLSPEVEAVRLSLYALARLKAYDALRTVVLDANGRLVSHWWPIAYALRRVDDPRAAEPLSMLLEGEGQYTRAFAARGLGAVKAAQAVPALIAAVQRASREPATGIEAMRALAELKAGAAAPVLRQLAIARETAPVVRVEAIAALGATGGGADAEAILDLLAAPEPAVRGAAVRAVAAMDPEGILTVLSGLDPDPQWTVRAAVAEAAGALPGGRGLARLESMLDDTDARVVGAVCTALAATKAPEAEALLVPKLQAEDAGVRAAAAEALGTLKARGAVEPLRAAYTAAQNDPLYIARGAILGALAAIDPQAATPVLVSALADKDWAVRVKAATLLKTIDPARETAAAMRPAPTIFDPAVYASPSVVQPQFSTHLYLDTDTGTIEVELAVLDAPLMVHALVDLARKGFFNGLAIHRVVPGFVVQDGDPRGDGQGGPPFTLRDELSERPYLRGTVGMALDWRDTGGSQYFITLTPQPHLDGRYTVLGQVVAGMDVVDRLAVGDVVRRVRVWDGQTAPY